MSQLFKFHKLSSAGQERAQFLAESFEEILTKVEKLLPEGRELSIVKTKLEEACFYAKKGMALQEKNQEREG